MEIMHKEKQESNFFIFSFFKKLYQKKYKEICCRTRLINYDGAALIYFSGWY